MDVNTREMGIPTNPKYVVNTILKNKIVEDPNICRYMFLDNIYESPQLLAIINSELNIRAAGT